MMSTPYKLQEATAAPNGNNTVITPNGAVQEVATDIC